MAKQKQSIQLSGAGTLLAAQPVHATIDKIVLDVSAGTFEINVVTSSGTTSRGRFSSSAIDYPDEIINPGDTITLTEPVAATGTVTMVFTTG